MKKSNFLLYFLVLIIISGFLIILFMREKNIKEAEVCFNEHCFEVEIAQTLAERSKGLMNREKLDEDKGMLFVFTQEGEHSFWMKNTLISLDIIWLNKDKEVVFIKKNAMPCKEEKCESIKPDKKARYVLELNAGMSDRIDLKIGDKLIFF